MPYAEISSVKTKGKWFGTRLAVATAEGKLVLSGVPQHLASELSERIRERAGGGAATAA